MKTTLLISCQKATELIEQQQDVNLDFKTGLKLKFHLLLCKTCQQYSKQSNLMQSFMSKYFKKEGSTTETTIDNIALKEKIISKLK